MSITAEKGRSEGRRTNEIFQGLKPMLIFAVITARLNNLRENSECQHIPYWCGVRRGPGGPRDSRPGGRRYLYLQQPTALSEQKLDSIPTGKML